MEGPGQERNSFGFRSASLPSTSPLPGSPRALLTLPPFSLSRTRLGNSSRKQPCSFSGGAPLARTPRLVSALGRMRGGGGNLAEGGGGQWGGETSLLLSSQSLCSYQTRFLVLSVLQKAGLPSNRVPLLLPSPPVSPVPQEQEEAPRLQGLGPAAPPHWVRKPPPGCVRGLVKLEQLKRCCSFLELMITLSP